MRTFLVAVFTLFVSIPVSISQDAAVIYSLQDKSAKAEAITAQDHEVLLKLYDSNIEAALQDWYEFLASIEQYANQQEVNLNGVKMWMNIFFNADGSIQAIGYHPKKGCKNMDWNIFETLLKEFSKQYQFPKQSDKPYSHYAAALWPVELLTGTSEE